MPQTGVLAHITLVRRIAPKVVVLSQCTVPVTGEAMVVATGVDHRVFVAKSTLLPSTLLMAVVGVVPATGSNPVLPVVAHSQSIVLDPGDLLVAAIRAAPKMSDAESTK